MDGTFGAGGYSRAILSAAACHVHAIDRDPSAVARGKTLEEASAGRFSMIEGRFGDMAALLRERGVNQVDGIALDIGVSSMQIDQPERGFSFAKDGPLDMRMETKGPSAADMVNDTPEGELANIIYRYGEERLSRRVAKAIVEARRIKRFERTGELAEVIRRVVPRSGDGIDPATRTFQALRIAVNDELGELERGLEAAEHLLAPGGHLAVVTFHSLEDRVVKSFLKSRSGEASRPSRHVPQAQDNGPAASFTLLSRKAIAPGQEESRANPRARSAKLRAAARTEAPAWGAAS
ncbi:rRNA small subunit methyltransferase H [Paramagnetospirillum magnetotacticum MS-1]|uniref:Ribosomal RNA small subunit methyltransferase H n=1 Tax=Paramagnetospirillum magnetotacticum MS-1 TaxID=272627 RepID=A0A0C2U5S0_PARME|nr:rRNA small subunit methyltransferase H [Paramagnetospirillum magnetotacticum MS-1]